MINCILGLKTTMTTGEWSCLISFAWDRLSCSEQAGIEKFKMKIYVSSGIRTHQLRAKTSDTAPYTARPRWLDINWVFLVLVYPGL